MRPFHRNSPAILAGIESLRAGMLSNGIRFDPRDHLFKMWHWAGRNSDAPCP